MTDSAAKARHGLLIQKHANGSAHHPLEVHHLAHDLRGPLNSILGFSELLLEGIEGPLNETQSEDIVAIYQSAQNLLYLINSVVDVSKLEAGTMRLEPDLVALDEVFQTVANFDFGASRPVQVEVVIDQQLRLPPIRADKVRVEQMILSLLRFAFTVKRAGRIEVTGSADDDAVTIQIIIPQATVSEDEHWFELGAIVDQAGRSELSPGGLELPLVSGLAKLHQGRVWLTSNAGHGTSLYLQLPVAGPT
ncbi:MAG: HAMP domain-containing sensor histidine kinase [Anaerolineae bacterium]|nr:HAMP domain-containing sensor histidine kinase [Anaerolineae bacterium]